MNVTYATMPVVVQVRPKGAGPFHWPHHLHAEQTGSYGEVYRLDFQWATVGVTIVEPVTDREETPVSVSGYAVGYHRQEAVPWSLVEQVIDAWFDAHDEENWLWEFQLVMEPAHHLARGAADREADTDRQGRGDPGPGAPKT